MAIEVVMPKFGLTMTEGTIQQWFKAEGDEVKQGEPLFEVETEKVLYEVEAPATGKLAKILWEAQATVPVGQVVAVIAEAAENAAEVAARYEAAPGAAVAAAPAAGEVPSAAAARRERVPATPAARRLAEQHGIDVSTLSGTGPGGRIVREDVERAIQAGPRPAPPAHGAPSPAAGSPVPPESVAFRGMRKVIADRMHRSLQSTAQLTITTEVDATELVARRSEVRLEFEVTYTDFIVQACARALRLHPRMNSALEGDAIVILHDAHVGLAVALDEGLIVPVIRHADSKPLRDIAREARDLAEKARAGRLTLDEVTGGTFTVSNLGMYGVDAFTPILNPPQTGILGVGRIVEKPAVCRGEIVPRPLMTLSLTFDHRIIDGAPAGEFLRTVADLLAHGNRISLDALR